MPANETEPSLLQYCYDTSSNVKDSFQCLETLGTRHFRMNTWFPWIFDGGEDGDWVGLRDRPWRLLGIIMFPTNPNAAKHCIAKWGWKTRYDLSYLLICATLNWKWTIVSCPTVPALFSNEKSPFFLTSIFLPWGVCFRHYAKLEAGERAIPPQSGGGTGASPKVKWLELQKPLKAEEVWPTTGGISNLVILEEKNNAY